MKKGNKKPKPENNRKFFNKNTTNEEERYNKYNEPKNTFNLASLDKIREEVNDPKKAFIKKNEKDISDDFQQKSNSDDDSPSDHKSENDDDSHSSSENPESPKMRKFDIKLFMMVISKNN